MTREPERPALTYTEVGRSLTAELPEGYRTLRHSRLLARDITFEDARAAMLSWQIHRRAGVTVAAPGGVAVDVEARLRLGLGPLRITAPIRVIAVIDEPDRVGYAYGTLPAHPESGEEAFVLTRDVQGITLTVTAFSRPAPRLAQLGGPVSRKVQDVITARYLRALG